MPESHVKERAIYPPTAVGTTIRTVVGVPNGTSKATANYPGKLGRQITVSRGNPFHTRVKGDMRDLGGNFYSQKRFQTWDSKGSMAVSTRDRFGREVVNHHTGPVLPTNPVTVGWPPDISSSTEVLEELGATAIARCKPTNSVADAATFLAELRQDGLPHLAGSSTWKGRNQVAKDAADDYLNVEFGWLPLVSDVKSFAKAVAHANTVLSQYERDAGKVVRRRYNFPVQKETEVIDFGEPYPAYFVPYDSDFETNNLPGGGMLKVETFKRQWFSGAFTYALPSGYDSRSALDRYGLMAEHVFGLKLTPEVLWNAAPWSWAADWFSNSGDVISNISSWSTDGLVMLYGYIMEHSYCVHTYTKPKTGLCNETAKASALTLVTETKIRHGANPFGFGVTWEGLSPLQLSIAAALGISRKP